MAKNKEEEGAKYRDYFDWHAPVASAPSHRILALLRAENEKVLKLKLEPPEGTAVAELHSLLIRRGLGLKLTHQLALALLASGDRDGAGREFERALEVDPSFAESDEARARLAELRQPQAG